MTRTIAKREDSKGSVSVASYMEKFLMQDISLNVLCLTSEALTHWEKGFIPFSLNLCC